MQFTSGELALLIKALGLAHHTNLGLPNTDRMEVARLKEGFELALVDQLQKEELEAELAKAEQEAANEAQEAEEAKAAKAKAKADAKAEKNEKENS
jgi:FKBP-type peptidyl-prolyl cis-trans isomerase